MFTVLATATFPHPPEPVFAALASVEGTVRWQSGVRGVWRARAGATAEQRPSSPPLPPSPGAPPGPEQPLLVLHYWALGVRHRLRARVTRHEPPERFAYHAEGDGLALDVAFVVAPAPRGCHVTCTAVLHDAASGALAAGTLAPGALAPGAPTPGAGDPDVVRLRRLLTRRLPRDLARLEEWVAVQPPVRRAPPSTEHA